MGSIVSIQDYLYDHENIPISINSLEGREENVLHHVLAPIECTAKSYGLLIAKHFHGEAEPYLTGRKMPLPILQDAHHVRVSSLGVELEHHSIVYFRIAKNLFFAEDASGRALPFPSLMPYTGCQLRQEEYDTLLDELAASGQRAAPLEKALGFLYHRSGCSKRRMGWPWNRQTMLLMPSGYGDQSSSKNVL